MIYSKRQFAEVLLEKLNKGYNPTQIGKWAFRLYLEDLEPGLEEIVFNLAAMECGPEFAWPEEKLRKLAQDLIEGSE